LDEDEEKPVSVVPVKRRRIKLPPAKVQEAIAPIPIQTIREISAPVISVPDLGIAELEEEDDDFLWLI
jgi:hypothetical protein